jgi:prolipoprotein diacylglyceryltransferase
MLNDVYSCHWAVVFESVDATARHPVQLYEAAAYLLTFAVLCFCYRSLGRRTPHGLLLGLFMTLVFSMRIIIEFFKEPQAAYEATPQMVTTGQYLSFLFALLGSDIVWWSIGSLCRASETNSSLR